MIIDFTKPVYLRKDGTYLVENEWGPAGISAEYTPFEYNSIQEYLKRGGKTVPDPESDGQTSEQRKALEAEIKEATEQELDKIWIREQRKKAKA